MRGLVAADTHKSVEAANKAAAIKALQRRSVDLEAAYRKLHPGAYRPAVQERRPEGGAISKSARRQCGASRCSATARPSTSTSTRDAKGDLESARQPGIGRLPVPDRDVSTRDRQPPTCGLEQGTSTVLPCAWGSLLETACDRRIDVEGAGPNPKARDPLPVTRASRVAATEDVLCDCPRPEGHEQRHAACAGRRERACVDSTQSPMASGSRSVDGVRPGPGSAAADERHLRRHHGHEQHVRVERQASPCRPPPGRRGSTSHRRLGRDRAVGLRHARRRIGSVISVAALPMSICPQAMSYGAAVQRGRPGQAGDRVLRGRVRRRVGPRSVGRDRAVVDDPAAAGLLALHDPERLAGAEERAGQVRVDDVRPLLDGELLERDGRVRRCRRC